MSTRSFREIIQEREQRDPDSADRVRREYDEQLQALGLRALRELSGHTQIEVADTLDANQSQVSRLERQGDAKLSTLQRYISATGGHMNVVVNYAHGTFDLQLGDHARGARDPLRTAVIRQNAETRTLLRVGIITVTDAAYIFEYSNEARTEPDFEPFPEFPDVETKYTRATLWPAFDRPDAVDGNAQKRPVRELLADHTPLPAELRYADMAGRTLMLGGSTVHLQPDPIRTPDGEILPILVSGARYAASEQSLTEEDFDNYLRDHVHVGDELQLVDDPENTENPNAAKLFHHDTRLGFFPDHQLEYLRKRQEMATVRVNVLATNPGLDHWHLKVLAEMRS